MIKNIIIIFLLIICCSCGRLQQTKTSSFSNIKTESTIPVSVNKDKPISSPKPTNSNNFVSFSKVKYDSINTYYGNDLKTNISLAENGDGNAADYLGNVYFANDVKNAFHWNEVAAALGNANGMYNLAYMYEFGIGIDINYDNAKNWYEKAAKEESPEANEKLGNMYLYGIGLDKNYGLAYEYLLAGAGFGDKAAMKELGTIYENGFGVDKDINQAAIWYQLSDSKSSELANIYGKYTLQSIDINKYNFEGDEAIANSKYKGQYISDDLIDLAKKYCFANDFDGFFKAYQFNYGLSQNSDILKKLNKNQSYTSVFQGDLVGDGGEEIFAYSGNNYADFYKGTEGYVQGNGIDIVGTESGIIKYNDKLYFVSANNNNYEKTPLKINIYAFDSGGICECASVSQTPSKYKFNFIETYNDKMQNNDLHYQIKSEIPKIIDTTKNDEIYHGSAETKLDQPDKTQFNELLNVDSENDIGYADLDNCGESEVFTKTLYSPVKKKNIELLKFSIFKNNYNNNEKSGIYKLSKKLDYKNKISRLKQVFVENIDDKNYVFALYGDENYYLSIYLLENEDIKLISNYLIYNVNDITVDMQQSDDITNLRKN